MTPIRNVSDRERQLCAEIDELRAELAKLKAVALSDDGAGGEGLMLYIRNRELNKELAKLKAQEPFGSVVVTNKGEMLFYELTARPYLDNAQAYFSVYIAAGAQGHTREQCPTCGEDEPFTGSCGTSYNDTKALCKRAALPHAHSSELKPYPPALDDRREGLGAHHVYCRAVTEDV